MINTRKGFKLTLADKDKCIEELKKLSSNQAESLRVIMLEEEKKRKRIEELEQQIEKMKCCGNCKYSNQESVYSIVCKVGGVDKSDYINIDDNQVCDKWEIKENG